MRGERKRRDIAEKMLSLARSLAFSLALSLSRSRSLSLSLALSLARARALSHTHTHTPDALEAVDNDGEVIENVIEGA